MTDLVVTKVAYQSEDRSWVYSDVSAEKGRASATLDVSTFTAGTHFPNGYIPSGTVLGRITATGLVGAYDPAATDGRETAIGFLWNATPVQAGGPDKLIAYWFGPGAIKEARLPQNSGLDAAAKVDLAGWFRVF